MKIVTEFIHIRTSGQGDFVDITVEVSDCLRRSGLAEGSAGIFAVGSTAGITTFEFEPGLVEDMRGVYEKLAPAGGDYAHHRTWGCDNGSSHVRSALQGCSLSVPFVGGELVLGRWQQIVLAEFDTRARDRKITVQLTGV